VVALLWVLVAVLLVVVLALWREIGRRSTAEEVSRRHASILESVLRSLGDGVVVSDNRARFTMFNPAAERIIGVGLTSEGPEHWGERYGVYLPDQVTPFPTQEFPLLRAIRGEESDEVEQFIVNSHVPQGVFISVNGRPLRDADGAIRGGVAIFRDITAQKRANSAIEDLNRRLTHTVSELQALNQEMESFNYSVSHDLRAPLRHIDGFVDLLCRRAGDALDEKSRHYLKVISEAAKQMGRLIDDLLAFSRMSRVEVLRSRVDLEGLVEDVRRDMGHEGQGRVIEWERGPLPTVMGDRSMLRMAVVNLLSNAVKYTRPCPKAQIQVGRAPSANGEVIVFVKDNGVGFDMKYADRLFGVFQRLHRTDEFEGTGIGLAIVRRVVHRHGGRVWAESAPGAGATFFVALPGAEEDHL
jgi:signal transduction histidine kinase